MAQCWRGRASSAMTMPIPPGTCVIATGIGSHAVVDVKGNRVTIAPSCYLKVSPAPLVPRKLQQLPRDLKNAILRVYSKLDQNRSWDGDYNAVIGVRG